MMMAYAARGPGSAEPATDAVAAGRRASVQRQVAGPVRGRGRRHGRARAATATVVAPVVGQYVRDHETGSAEMVQGHGAGCRRGRQFVHGHSRLRPIVVSSAGGHCSC